MNLDERFGYSDGILTYDGYPVCILDVSVIETIASE